MNDEKIKKANKLGLYMAVFAFGLLLGLTIDQLCTAGGGVLQCALPGASLGGL